MKITSLIILLGLFSWAASAQVPGAFVTSPDKHLSVQLTLKDGLAGYQVFKNNQPLLAPSALGLVLTDVDLSKNLKEVSKSPEKTITQTYAMCNAKKANLRYQAKQRSWTLATPTAQSLEIIFQVSNDAVAFRYRVKRPKEAISKVESEPTSFAFLAESRAWLQPMAVAKSGWEATNPSYEETYEQDIAVGTPSTKGAGWVYPALFKTKDTWILLTEAGLDSTYCATRLQDQSPGANISLAFRMPVKSLKTKI
ncbi:glycoside hydrolase family 97 N-terminal domain-containing protein [Siphonobacter sp. BAB-5385]|uniref:glycoside hydrolase family 97 N-terminal domain-containing protein n=1 Tax=Siphonobacter sp. BAB-5385 TaxID=1864822 RepID=UPI001C3C6E26|nr:glycoside hydrolase family 97 N-terminal domain-containing protein [Siphonobacter sp. BAB-5385]